MVKDSEGSLTFLTDSDRETVPLRGSVMGEGGVGGVGGNGGGCSEAGSGSDRCARLLELVKDVSSHLDVTALCHKIFLHINELIAADRYSLFLVGIDGCIDKAFEKYHVKASINYISKKGQGYKRLYLNL